MLSYFRQLENLIEYIISYIEEAETAQEWDEKQVLVKLALV